MKLEFHGADRDVTGSCHLVECAGKRILIDCGLFQGSRELSEQNADGFGFDPAAIDYVLLTHAHLDHCGRLPLLSKRGFRGEIISTGATRELARLVMLDAAHLQEQEAGAATSRDALRSKQGQAAAPLYSVLDALNSLDGFGRTANYGQPLELATAGRATFIDAGHILGSASILLELAEPGRAVRLLFSGDLGNSGRPLLGPPATPPRADVVVIETTYGDRRHKPMRPSIEEFYEAISDTFRRGGNVVIPTFALERAQELLYILHQGVATGRLLPSTQVFLDSPLAISATEVFRRHLECLDPQAAHLFRQSVVAARPAPGQRAGSIGRAQYHSRRRHHHGRLRHGDRRSGTPSSQAQFGARGVFGRFCWLRCQRNPGSRDYRWSQPGARAGRGGCSPRPHLHHQRLFRPC